MSDVYQLNDRVLLLLHTPFGINEYYLYKFYDIKYEQKLLPIIEKYSSHIIMCLTAHRHHDLFRIYSSLNTTMGILGHPSINPMSYLTQPSIRKYSYNRKSLILKDYEQYSLNIIESEHTQKDYWKLSYRFSSWYYQSNELTSKTLFHLIYLIRTNYFYLKRFLITKHNAEKIILNQHQIIKTLCAVTLFNFDELMLCTRILRKKTTMNYNQIIINGGLDTDLFINEQLNEYKIIYRRVAISLFILIVFISLIIYQHYWKDFYRTVFY